VNAPSRARNVQQALAITYALFTAVVALMWVLPKFGEGGFAWLLTLPVALLFPLLTYVALFPDDGPDPFWQQIAFAVVLAVAFFFGQWIAAVSLPEQNRSGTAAAMLTLTATWRNCGLFVLLVSGALTLLRRSRSNREALVPVAAAMPHGAGVAAVPAPSPLLASNRDAALDWEPGEQTPHHSRPEPVRSHPAATPQSALNAISAGNSAQNPPVTAPRMRPEQETRPAMAVATVSGASFYELTTLVEIADSLGAPDPSTSLLLSGSPAGLDVAAAGMDLGTVRGAWSGLRPLRVHLSAREMMQALATLSPAPETLTLRFRVGDETAIVVQADGSVQRFALDAIEA
jgi:hypothetical protein